MKRKGSAMVVGASIVKAKEANVLCFSRAVGLVLEKPVEVGDRGTVLLASGVLSPSSLPLLFSVSKASSGSSKKASGDSPSLTALARLALLLKSSTSLKRTRFFGPPVEGGVRGYEHGGVCGRSNGVSILAMVLYFIRSGLLGSRRRVR